MIQPPDRPSFSAGFFRFFRMEEAGGVVLLLASALALVIANSGFYGIYDHVLNRIDFLIGFTTPGGAEIGLRKTPLHWINDGLMVVFFFVIGLEIKRELLVGELSSRAKALLPLLAALGGMAVPASVYLLVNHDVPGNLPGWAISSATDIAFAVCMVALAGARVPVSLKILLMAIAVIDDLGAIIIIALFYAHGFNPAPLVIAMIAMAGLYLLNRRGVLSYAPYIALGVMVWLAVMQSGIHATLAGVMTALFIPLRVEGRTGLSPAEHLARRLQPYVAFLVLPVFGLANAGVPFDGMGLSNFTDKLTLGIILGLVIGKPLGIFTAVFLAVRCGLSPMPQGAGWMQVFGIAALCGIGFTMSLFIGGLAFAGIEQQAEIRLGVLSGSLVSALFGSLILRFAPPVTHGRRRIDMV